MMSRPANVIITTSIPCKLTERKVGGALGHGYRKVRSENRSRGFSRKIRSKGRLKPRLRYKSARFGDFVNRLCNNLELQARVSCSLLARLSTSQVSLWTICYEYGQGNPRGTLSPILDVGRYTRLMVSMGESSRIAPGLSRFPHCPWQGEILGQATE